MSVMATHARLTDGQRRALGFAVVLVAAGMAIGFLASFTTLYAAAQAQHWRFPALFPLAVDAGILAYVILDHLAVTLGDRSRWLHVVAWGFAAFTVWANAAVTAGDSGTWRVIHAAMPAIWVLGVEALRFTWRRLNAAPAQTDRIPAGRWIAAPWPTLLLWRRMRLLGVTAWPLMCAMEDARMHLRDLTEAVTEKYPDRVIPSVVRRVARTGRFPGEVSERIRSSLEYGGAATWEPALETWLSDRLRLPKGISEAISADSTSTAPEPSPALHETPAPALHEAPLVTPSRERSRKPSKPNPRRMSDDDLMPYVRDLLAADPGTSMGAVRRATGTGPERARKLLERGQDEERQNRMVRVK